MAQRVKVQTSGSERRILHRFKQPLPTILTFDEGLEGSSESKQLLAYTADVSAGGAFFRTEQNCGEGKAVTIQCLLPYDEELIALEGKRNHSLLFATGTVIRRDGQGIAVKFSSQFEVMPIAA